MLSSCIKDEAINCPSFTDKIRFTLQVQEEGVQYITRTTDEQNVRDVNIFLYDPHGVLPAQHLYTENGAVECSIVPGRYEAYTIANLHRDMGEMSRDELLAVQLPAVTNYETLPMSGRTILTIEDRMSAPIITVRRAVAKIVCNVSIERSVVNTMVLRSVQIINAAATTKLFDEKQVADRFVSVASPAIASSENRMATRTFYLLENCQGDVPSITTQQQKCAANAPKGATYLRIAAQRDGKQLIFNVYLGENNTSNFDVRRNTVQMLDIRIVGENEIDMRIHSLEVNITDDLPDPEFSTSWTEYCWNDLEQKYLTVTPDKPTKIGSLIGDIRFIQGQQYAFRINGLTLNPELPLHLNDLVGICTFDVRYDPNVYTAANSRLIYDVSLTNGDGFSYTKRFTHDFYNHLVVYTHWNGQEQSGGRLEDVSAVSYMTYRGVSQYYTRILALDDGPQMRAVCNDGFAFKGWYADRELTREVSQANPYRYPMTRTRDTLYAKFARDQVYIYTRIDEVNFSSHNGYKVDLLKQAFIVPYGSRCTISSRNGQLVRWWDGPEDAFPRHIVSAENPYSFTATANITLWPSYYMILRRTQEAVPHSRLSDNRTATSTD